MNKSLQDSPQNRELKVSGVPSNLNPLALETHNNNQCYTSPEEATSSSSQERCWKTEEMHPSSDAEGNEEIHQGVRLNRSRSVGSELDRVGKLCSDEDEAGQGYSGDDSHENNCDRSFDASDHNCDSHELEVDLHNQYHKAPRHDDASFTSGDQDQLEEGPRDNGLELSGEQAEESGNHLSFIPHPIAKSYSLPNFGDLSPTSGEASPSNVHEEPIDRYSQNSDCLDADRKEYWSDDARPRAMSDQEREASPSNVHDRYSQNLDCLDADRKEYWSDDARPRAMSDQERDNTRVETERERFENSFSDEYDSSNFNGLTKGWSPPGLNVNNRSQSSVSWDELPSKDFKIMRIEEWVSRIDLHDKDQLEEIDEDRCLLQEIGESSHSTEKVKKPSDILGSSVAVKLEGKNPMEAAKKYVSTLTATSTTAQLVNFGLVAVPFLSAFVSLRVLNLSGNAIVRITAGALPRGLHALNLSKNNISTIEGLRELTRLRILDLSYNRISRIGHGLASCASLKELYLAGNKISEVEGFHRLLKLNVLDLRFNKISTSKCLGQLAANYMSLQSVSLEGNPAQRNVGEEQLKKYVLSLVPRLVYYNKQPIRVGSSKEAADRPPRSSGHQFDRGLRADAHKLNKKSLHDLATSKLPPSLMAGRAGRAASSSKQSRSRHRLFHSSGTKATHHHHHPDLGEKLLSMQATFSMRRSQSEGNFLPN